MGAKGSGAKRRTDQIEVWTLKGEDAPMSANEAKLVKRTRERLKMVRIGAAQMRSACDAFFRERGMV